MLALADPAQIVGVDTSEGFLTDVSVRMGDTRSTFCAGDARSLPLQDRRFDAMVSGLGGVAAGYVWGYARAIAMMGYLWHAATALDPAARLDEGGRFPHDQRCVAIPGVTAA